jgi:hypothetical protein
MARHRSVVGGPGDDRLDDSAGGGTAFFDFEGDNEVVEGLAIELAGAPLAFWVGAARTRGSDDTLVYVRSGLGF